MTRIFFDTEFTALTPGAALISIGLVDESGTSDFYAELTDTYEAGDCSDFCRQEVLPLLEHGAAAMTLPELQDRLYSWLFARGPGAVLVCDSPRDVVQLRMLFPRGLPLNCGLEVLGWWGNARRRLFNRGRRIHRQLGLRVHHALDDAKVNRAVLTNPLG
jgi:3' exoribonuclease, RNase T-like